MELNEYRLLLKTALEKQPESEFVIGCMIFFIKAGFLTELQVTSLKNTKSDYEWAIQNDLNRNNSSRYYDDHEYGPGGEGDPMNYCD